MKATHGDAATFAVLATVIVVVHEFHQAVLRTADDEHQLAITRHTQDVALADVREGEVYRLTVTRRLSRVLHPSLVSPAPTDGEPSEQS